VKAGLLGRINKGCCVSLLPTLHNKSDIYIYRRIKFILILIRNPNHTTTKISHEVKQEEYSALNLGINMDLCGKHTLSNSPRILYQL
jgi:hypothetical protein